MKNYKIDRREFLILPSLPFGIRVFLSFLLLLLIFNLQLRGKWIIWIPLFVFLGLFNWVREVKIPAPFFAGTGKKWKRVTERELEEALSRSRRVKRLKASFSSKIVLLIFIIIFSVIFTVTLPGFAPGLYNFLFSGEAGSYFLMDLILLLLLAFFTGNRSLWEPGDFPHKLPAIKVAYEYLKERREPNLEESIEFEVVETRDGRYVPTDVKLFLNYRKKEGNIYGLQFQVSINEVQGKKYPYFYGVIVGERELGLANFKENLNYEKLPSWAVVEFQPQGEIDVLVVRQETSRSRGYHTSGRRIKQIVELCLLLFKQILKLNIRSL